MGSNPSFFPPEAPRKPRIRRAEGIWFEDDTGRRTIDASSGPVASNLGHGNKRVLAAMGAQAELAAFATPSQFESAANVALAEKLAALCGPGLDRAFMTSGGSEAIETAIRFCRQHAVWRGEPGRWKVISRMPSYHGNTFGALAITGDPAAHALFGPMMVAMPKVPAPWTYRIPDGYSAASYAAECADALERTILAEGAGSVLAFIMEPVGGLATGALVAVDAYYTAVRDICTRHGILLIHDEVMSGAGRTGTFLAAEHWPGARPDIAVLAKGVSAGYAPLGVVMVPAAMAEDLAGSGGFNAGFTYFANPLACAVGAAVLDELVERNLMANAALQGARMRQRLDAIAAGSRILGDVRGRGLLLAIELVADKAEKRPIPVALNAPERLKAIGFAHGLMLYGRRTAGGHFGEWLMISPPLIVTAEEVDDIADRLAASLGEYETELARAGGGVTVPLVGYLDRWSARPGEAIAVKVSSTLAGPYAADLVRIIHADPNPAGPGLKLEAVPSAWAGAYPSRVQAVVPGSYGVVDAGLAVPDGGAIRVRVQPGLLSAPQPVLALGGAVLRVAAAGARWDVDGVPVCAVPAPMLERCWYEIEARFTTGAVHLAQRALQTNWGVADTGAAMGEAPPPRGARLLIGADAQGGRFDGRIEAPCLLDSSGNPVAEWDFSVGIETDRIAGTHPGHLVNLPTRGIRGSRWTGEEMDWKHAPGHYAAIHFHADDLYDAGWDTDFTVSIPDGLRSGVYGVRLRGGGHEDIIPFFVLALRGTATAPVAYLAATFTYQAYANHARFNFDPAFRARAAAWGATPHNPEDHPEYGASTYNRHPDGTGISLSSLRRPVLTLRPGFLTFNDQRGSGLRHFSADSHLTDWLEAIGQGFDVITDHDLHREGAALLAPYRCVLTGSHPEYHTPQTLDALGTFIGAGGRLCYLGGNGFYWRIAVSDGVPDVLEVRRTEGGIRAWDAAPGEAYHQLDGGYGGLWRRLGRPPQQLAGVGFSSQGLFEGSHYRRLPASYDPGVAWIFAGVEGDTLGDYGLSGGGAAGFELDRADRRLGTPPNAVVLARSEAHQPHFVAVPEELLSHVNTVTGEAPRDLIRAEVVYFDTAQGGAVFATGSITFCGSLSHNGYENGVSRMMRNVVTRFAG